jgi:Ser/Thr protein kinase RdoA (MazF antagonist)
VTAEALVRAALRRYGVRPRRLRPLAAEVVRVDAGDGQAFALRCRPRSGRVFGDIPLELAWTAALRRDTDIRPPEPVPGLDGALVQDVAAPGVPEPYDCVLSRWIPGPTLADRLTLENVRRLGVLSARLHEHAAGFRPPASLPVRSLDQLLRGGERAVLFAYEHPAFLPPARRAVFARVAERFRLTVAALYADPAGRRVIHADLHHQNVKLDRGRLRPLDFYEVIWGYPAQDVALTLYDLRYYTDPGRHEYAALREAFAGGYASRLPWPEAHPGQLDTLVAGRRLRQANWVLWRETAPFAPDPGAVPDPAALVPYFERVEAELRALLDGVP